MRNILFLSHATHEDNYFASWLASKLILLGYQVWLDIDDIKTGDSFNTKIEPIIRNKAGKFLAITSKTYSLKSKDQNSGVTKELNCADTIRDIENFILPLKLDDINYNDFSYHYLGRDSINFSENWQPGLIALVDQLESINFPKIENKENPIYNWFNVIRNNTGLVNREENYHSNWFEMTLPENIFIYRLDNFDKKDLYSIPFPYILESNYLISFFNENTAKLILNFADSLSLSLQDFTKNEIELCADRFVINEPKKKLVKLLNIAFNNHLYKKDLISWKKGKKGNKKLFYFKTSKEQKTISLKKIWYKKRQKSINRMYNRIN